MKNEQEIIANINAILAYALRRHFGYTQAEIARKLYVTSSAVSQYISKARGGNIDFSNEVIIEIEKLANLLHDSKVLPQHVLRERKYKILMLHLKVQDEQEMLAYVLAQ